MNTPVSGGANTNTLENVCYVLYTSVPELVVCVLVANSNVDNTRVSNKTVGNTKSVVAKRGPRTVYFPVAHTKTKCGPNVAKVNNNLPGKYGPADTNPPKTVVYGTASRGRTWWVDTSAFSLRTMNTVTSTPTAVSYRL